MRPSRPLVVAAVIAALLCSARWASPPPSPAPQLLIVRVPEAAPHLARTVDRWLEALDKAGFSVVPLSGALDRPMPERAVALVFEPAYRRTYRDLRPVLRRRGARVLWITDARALNGDPRFADPNHDDVAFFSVTPRAFTLTRGGGLGFVWAPRAGARALNVPLDPKALQRLDARPDWSGRELVERLERELPREVEIASRTKLY